MWVGCLVLAVPVTVAGAPDEPPDLAAQMDAARADLDAAARRLAELHRQVGDTVRFVTSGVALHDRAMLGVLLGQRRGQGIEIVGVTPGGGAEAAGLHSGDVLLAIDGRAIEGSAETLIQQLAGREAGTQVDVDYERDGQRSVVAVELQAAGAARWALPAPFDLDIESADGGIFIGRGGTRFFDLDADLGSYFGVDSGVLVLRPAPGMEALRSGDVIRAIDAAPVTNAIDLQHRLRAANGEVDLDVLRHDEAQRIRVSAQAIVGPGRPWPHDSATPAAGVFRIHLDTPASPGPPGAAASPPERSTQPDDAE